MVAGKDIAYFMRTVALAPPVCVTDSPEPFRFCRMKISLLAPNCVTYNDIAFPICVTVASLPLPFCTAIERLY